MVKKGDFIIIEYTGYNEKGNIFDSTEGKIAKELHGKEGPMLLMFGYDYIIPGLAEELEKMKEGEEKEIEIPPEKAFGKRSRKLVKVFSPSDFNNNVNLIPGAAIEIQTPEGITLKGVVKTITSGRVMIDFNHPLADHKVKYKIKLNKVITKKEEKIKTLMEDIGLKGDFEIKDEKITFNLENVKDLKTKQARILMAINVAIPEIKKVDFKEKNEKK